MKKQILTLFLAFSTIFVACKPNKNPTTQSQDAKWQQAIIGTWRYTDIGADGVVTEARTTYLPNGRADTLGTNKRGDKEQRLEVSWKWHVTDGYIYHVLERANTLDIPVGYTSADKIVDVTDTEFTYVQGEGGKTKVDTRVK